MKISAQSAGWTQQLLEAAAAVGGIHSMEGVGAGRQQQIGCAAEAAVVRQQELLLQAVGLRLLLATMAARC